MKYFSSFLDLFFPEEVNSVTHNTGCRIISFQISISNQPIFCTVPTEIKQTISTESKLFLEINKV